MFHTGGDCAACQPLLFPPPTKVKRRTFLVSMDVTSLYTNIPQEEGIITVCNAYGKFYKDNPPIPTHYLREMLRPSSDAELFMSRT